MSRPKGLPKTGGRKKGTPNKRAAQFVAKVQECAAAIEGALGPNAFEGDAHAFLMTVYKDTAQPLALRLDAAKAAAPFEKPKLANVDQKLSGNVGYTPVQVSERDAFDPVDATGRSPNGRDPSPSRH